MTHPYVLEVAREIVAQTVHSEECPLGHDHWDQALLDTHEIRCECDIHERVAIAAIEKATKLSIRNHVGGWVDALALQRYDHLRQSEKDNSDAD
jgi:hypothetical protein